MFPDARISLRRWSLYAETKIPIPMAITLHNYVAPSTSSSSTTTTSNNSSNELIVGRDRAGSVDSTYSLRDRSGSADSTYSNHSTSSHHQHESPTHSPTKEESRGGMWLLHRQPQHTNNLLPRLRLDISTKVQDDDDNNALQLYSQPSPETPSLHPSWEHLDERISVENCQDWWNQNELYKSMKVKLSVVTRAEDKDNPQESFKVNTEEECFLEAFLHPSYMERIDLLGHNNNNNNNNNNNQDDLDESEQALESKLPPSLPPNALLVHFSDGSIRCPPNTYKILWDTYGNRILKPPSVEDFSRFEDDAFATLDHVEQTPRRPRNRSVSSLLDTDQEASATPVHQKPREALQENLHTPAPQNGSNNFTTTNNPTFPQQHDAYNFNQQEIRREERRLEKLELLRLIAEEEEALEDDLECLQAEQQTLKDLVKDIQTVESDIAKVQTELGKQSTKQEKEELLKESQSFKLIRDLRDIYPIAQDSAQYSSNGLIQSTRQAENAVSNTSFLIRGLRLPTDIYTTTISEEEVNTALGYCAHLVFMVAKYLAIPLRYRIFCNGSRSAIELDAVGIFPLFLGRLAARALEREQVDRGARLLGTNVDCILGHLDLDLSPSTHMLEKLQTILKFAAEGKRTLSKD